MKYIGLDIGTTSISAVTVDENREVIKSCTIENGSFLPVDADFKKLQDTEKILTRAKDLLNQILEEFPDTAAIGLTGQMHGIVYTDNTGYAAGPLITWQDDRGNQPVRGGRSVCRQLEEDFGIHAFSGYGLVSHLYNLQTGNVPESAVSLCTIGDYIGMQLTGRTTPLLHVSNAASLGFFDTEQKHFRISELKNAGIDCSILPSVTAEFEILGNYKGIPVFTAIGDNQASFLGSVSDKEDTVLINMGTGGQISVCVDQYLEVPGIETRPLNNQQYLLVGASLCGGRAYALLEQFFRSFAKRIDPDIKDCYGIMEEILAEEGIESELTVAPLFSGTRTDPFQRGSITGISTENFTPSQLISGMLTGMSRELYDMYRQIQTLEGRNRYKIIASGNGVRKNQHLQRILSRMFGMEIQLAAVTEEAACGAAFEIRIR